MPVKLQKIWKNLYETFKGPTEICKICFNEIKPKRIVNLMTIHNVLCDSCADLFNPIWKRFKLCGYTARAIYHYDETIRTYLYQFKGCYDYELYPVFLYKYALYLRFHYRGYIIIPAPSYPPDDEARGFNHVEMIFSLLNLKIMKIFTKLEHHKQADCSIEERKDIGKYMKVKEKVDLTGKKILLVDDVYTSGSTMSFMLENVRKMNPKKIEILVLSKTI